VSSVALPGARAEDIDRADHASGLLIETTVPPPSFAPACTWCAWRFPMAGCGGASICRPARYALLEHRLDRLFVFALDGVNL
jgi:hypothetical protein